MEKLKLYAKKAIPISLVILTLILLVNSYSILKLAKGLDLLSEKSKPVSVELLSLDCDSDKCADLDEELAQLKSHNMLDVDKETSLNFDEAKDIIAKYSIKHLPALIVKGDVDKIELTGYRREGDALVLESKTAPYEDAVTGAVAGLVKSVVVYDPNCKDKCPNLSMIVNGLEQNGVVFTEKTMLTSAEAKELLEINNITRLPLLALSKEFSEYDVSQNWENLGIIAADGSYMLQLDSPPYYDIVKKKIIGLVTMTAINDASCSKCYNGTAVHSEVVTRFGIYLDEVKSLDASSAEAKQLISKYNIKSLPTIILSKEAAEYKALMQAWDSVGTVESDGSLVFRDNEVLGLTYKDLSSNKVIEAESSQ